MGKCSKDKRDIYYRKAKELGYRARSAFKLLQLDDEFQLFQDVSRVVDLCAAPGGWSQVIVERLKAQENKVIIAVDLMEMAEISQVIQIKGDITAQTTADEIIRQFSGQLAHIVVSDGAPDVLGLPDVDEYLQAQLVLAALNISIHILEPGGTFVAKIFRGKDVSLLYAQLKHFFKSVICAKPKASRNSSFESFVVCKGFALPADHQLSMKDPLLDFKYGSPSNELLGSKNLVIPFQSCGNVEGYDADQSYPVDDAQGYLHQQPLQKPINPPYLQSLQLKMNGKIN